MPAGTCRSGRRCWPSWSRRAKRPGAAVLGKAPLAAAEQDRLDHQAVLVDEVMLDQLGSERGAAHDLQPLAVPYAQLAHRADHVVGRQQGRS